MRSYKELTNIPSQDINAVAEAADKFYKHVVTMENMTEDQRGNIMDRGSNFATLYKEKAAAIGTLTLQDLSLADISALVASTSSTSPFLNHLMVQEVATELKMFFDPAIDDSLRPNLSEESLDRALNIMMGVALTFDKEDAKRQQSQDQEMTFGSSVNIKGLQAAYNLSHALDVHDRQYPLVTELGLDVKPLLSFDAQLANLGKVIDEDKTFYAVRAMRNPHLDPDLSIASFDILREQLASAARKIYAMHKTIELLSQYPPDVAFNIAVGSGYAKDLQLHQYNLHDPKIALKSFDDALSSLENCIKDCTKLTNICRDVVQNAVYIDRDATQRVELLKNADTLSAFCQSALQFYEDNRNQIQHAVSDISQYYTGISNRRGFFLGSAQYKSRPVLVPDQQPMEFTNSQGETVNVNVKVVHSYSQMLRSTENGKVEKGGLIEQGSIVDGRSQVWVENGSIVNYGVHLLDNTLIGKNSFISPPEPVLPIEKLAFEAYLHHLYDNYVRRGGKDSFIEYWQNEKTPPVSMSEFRIWGRNQEQFADIFTLNRNHAVLTIGGTVMGADIKAHGVSLCPIQAIAGLAIRGQIETPPDGMIVGFCEAFAKRFADIIALTTEDIQRLGQQIDKRIDDIDKTRETLANIAINQGPNVLLSRNDWKDERVENPTIKEMARLNASINEDQLALSKMIEERNQLLTQLGQLKASYMRDKAELHDVTLENCGVIVINDGEKVQGAVKNHIPEAYQLQEANREAIREEIHEAREYMNSLVDSPIPAYQTDELYSPRTKGISREDYSDLVDYDPDFF